MEMRIRLKEMLKQHKLTPYAVAQLDERISLSALYRLRRANGRARYLDSTLLDALCDVFKCEPGELLQRE